MNFLLLKSIFITSVLVLHMADPPSPPKRDWSAPKNEKNEIILQRQRIFHLWNQKGTDIGFEEKINS